MGGLGKLFTRIIPIIMLVCFVCFGITHAFNEVGIENKTYLSSQTINVGTQENPQTIKYYNLDVVSYLNGVNSNILTRSIDKVIEIDTYKQTLNSFNNIWKDGYQVGDIIRTVGNGILLVVNTIILPINILLVPIRIIAGIIITALSLVGINTSKKGIITDSLNAIIDNLAIPLIKPIFDKNPNSLINQTYIFNENIRMFWNNYNNDLTYPIQFTCNNQQYTSLRMTINFWETDTYIYYIYLDNNQQQQQLVVYHNGWLQQEYRTITITGFGTQSQNDYESIMLMLDQYAVKQ